MRFSSTSCPKKPLLPVLTFPTFHIPPASYLAYSAGVSHVFTNYSISSRSGRFAAMLDSFSSLPKPFPNFESKMALAWSKYTCYSPRLLPPCCPPSIPPPQDNQVLLLIHFNLLFVGCYLFQLHLVHWNCESANYSTFKDAVGSGDPNGLCVLGFFLKV